MKTLEDDFIWLFPLSTKGEKINSSCSKRNRNERRKKFWSCQVRTFESYRIEITPDWWKVDPPLWNQAERHSELWKSFPLLFTLLVVQLPSHVQLLATPWTSILQVLFSPLSLRVYSNLCPLSRWCYLTISSSAALFSCLQSFPASRPFPMSIKSFTFAVL